MKEHPEIPCFTIHDSLVSLPKYLDLIEEIARQEIESYIGYKPILKKEIWAEEIKLAS
ncbi:MAG: hypothetical protein IPI19_16875 [Ignavibacteriales bacterium]|nr:hypothetical protein [Ignavibacteriales bacterium]